MKKNYVKFNTFKNANEEFKENTASLLENYFCPEGLGLEGYLCVGKYNKTLAKKFSTNSGNQKNLLIPTKNKELNESFSFYEKLLASQILYGKMKTIVVSGAMGSGKSTTIDYIFKVLKQEKNLKSIIIKIDFNQGYSSKGIDELNDTFLEELYSKLHAEVINNFASLGLSDKFLKKVLTECQNYSKFYDFSFEKIYNADRDWEKSDEKSKIFMLFKFIKENAKRLEHRVEMVMKFISFINIVLHENGDKIILFYDNLDKLPPAAQHNILNKIIAYNHIANVTKVIAIRRSTKAKLDRLMDREISSLVDNRGQTVYGHVYHHGPSPWRLYKEKIIKLIDYFDEIKLFKHLDTEFKLAIIKRAKEIKENLSSKNNDLKKAIYCVAGESNRLGLTLASRNFCNNIYPFHEKVINTRSLVRSIYCGFNDKNTISNKDEYIVNIYSNSKYEFDIINYLIFHILKEESKNENPKTNVSYLYNFLLNHFEYSSDEILSSLNYLLKDKRALLGGQFYPHYKNADELFRVDDKLRITELGERYFEQLIENGVTYNQTCLFSLRWEFGSEKVHKDNLINRIEFLIAMLNDAIKIEYNRHQLYQLNISEFKIIDYKIDSIICKITSLIFKMFIKIAEKQESNSRMVNSLNGWVEKVAAWNYLYYDIFSKQTQSLLIEMKYSISNIKVRNN